MIECKECSRCKETKPLNMFRGTRNQCKSCEKELIKEWRNKNKEHIKEYGKKYFQEHKEELKEKRKDYMYEYRQTLKYKKHKKEYAKKNIEKYNEYARKRYKNDIMFKLKHNIRVELLRSFKIKNKKKNFHTEKIIGCSTETLINHLLDTYRKNYGYEWNGIENIHIDHIVPLKEAQTEDELIKLNHYTNLQLLKSIDNLKKASKISYKLNKDQT